MLSKLKLGFAVICLVAVACSGGDGDPVSMSPSDQDAGTPNGVTGGSDSAPDSGNGTDEPSWGVVVDRTSQGTMTDAQIAQMQELGVDYAKFWVAWNETEPELVSYEADADQFGIAGDQPTELTRDLLAANPEWIDEYAFPERAGSRFGNLIDWTSLDAQVDQLVDAGVAPFPLIADATTAPRLSDPDGILAPEPLGFRGTAGESLYAGIGREAYLAHVQLYAAGAARRYSESARRITWWNLENELNFTPLHVQLMGWRTGDAWLDEDFHLELLATLAQGLKLGSPNALATHNVQIWDPNWADALARYAPHLDGLGLGSYPNYLEPEPVKSQVLADAVETATALGEERGKPVFVLETGYPSAPTSGGWTEELQAEYLSTAPAAAIEAGAAGYFHFTLNDRSWDVPEGELQQVEPHWGLVRVDGTHKPSFEVFRDVIDRP